MTTRILHKEKKISEEIICQGDMDPKYEHGLVDSVPYREWYKYILCDGCWEPYELVCSFNSQ
jgi:hypothetical protein